MPMVKRDVPMRQNIFIGYYLQNEFYKIFLVRAVVAELGLAILFL